MNLLKSSNTGLTIRLQCPPTLDSMLDYGINYAEPIVIHAVKALSSGLLKTSVNRELERSGKLKILREHFRYEGPRIEFSDAKEQRVNIDDLIDTLYRADVNRPERTAVRQFTLKIDNKEDSARFTFRKNSGAFELSTINDRLAYQFDIKYIKEVNKILLHNLGVIVPPTNVILAGANTYELE